LTEEIDFSITPQLFTSPGVDVNRVVDLFTVIGFASWSLTWFPLWELCLHIQFFFQKNTMKPFYFLNHFAFSNLLLNAGVACITV